MFSYNFIYLYSVVLFFSFSEALAALKASELFTGEYLQGKDNGSIEGIVKNGIRLKLNKQDAVPSFEEAAHYGSTGAMVHLGRHYFEIGEKINNKKFQEEGLRWYMLAFQTHWENTGTYLQSAMNILSAGLTKDFYAFYPLFDPKKEEKVIHFHKLAALYSSKDPIEAGLTLAEKERKTARYVHLITQTSLVFHKTQVIEEENKDNRDTLTSIYLSSWEKLGKYYSNGVLGRSIPRKDQIRLSSEAFEKACTPEANYMLGEMYMYGEICEDLPQKTRDNLAANCFEKARTPQAKINLGFLYSTGRIKTELSEKERNETAAKLYMEANIPEGKFNLGAMYEEKKIGESLSEKERIELITRFYGESNIPLARYNLGVMYRRKIIGENLPEKERYRRAAHYFEGINSPEAKTNLGYLYLNDLIGESLSSQQRYTEAAKLFEGANIPVAIHNLACLYLKGYNPPYIQMNEVQRNKTAADLFKKSSLPLSRYALADLMLSFPSDVLPNVPALGYCEKASQLLTQAMFEGIADERNLQERIEDILAEEFHKTEDGPKNTNEQFEDITHSNDVKIESHNTDRPSLLRELPRRSKKEKNHQKKQDKLASLNEFLSKRGAILLEPKSSFESKQQKLEQLSFLNEQVKENFEHLLGAHNKTNQLVDDILYRPWGIEGAGKPELLKYGKYKGCYSRRINIKDRLVYRIAGGNIEILACEGHY